MARLYRRYRRYRRRRTVDEPVPSSSRTPSRAKPSSGRAGAGPTAALGVQAKLRVNVPGDRYEREADAVADAVASGRSAPAVSMLGSGGLPGAPAQRQALDEEETPVQRQAMDEEEEPIQRQVLEEEEEEEPVQRQVLEDEDEMMAQRQSDEEEEMLQAKDASAARGKTASDRGTATQAAVRAMARAGAGAPLPPGLRIRLEHSLGHDLRSMRVHKSSAGREISTALNARAVTRARDVYLGPGASVSDLRLMAHEATHVVQQGQASTHVAAPVQRQAEGPSPEDHRSYVEDVVRLLDAAASAYQRGRAVDASSIEQTLQGWYTSAETALEAIETDLGGDEALQRSVRRAYQRAVRAYMPRAGEATGQTLPALYQEHHTSIHPWAWLPSSANPQANALLGGLPERERRQIRVVMTREAVAIPGAQVDEYFSTEGATVTHRTPSGVTVTFGDGIASELQRGLQSVMGHLIGRQNLQVNRTVVLLLDLTAHGGDCDAYRFTYVQHVDARGTPTSREILIERLGEVGTQGLEGDALEAARARFARYGFSFGRGWFEDVPHDRVERFRELIERAEAAQEGLTETITPSGTTYVVQGDDLQETEVSGARATAFRRAVTRQGGVPISTYAEQDWGELYAELFSLYVTDPAALHRLRPRIFEYFENRFGDGPSGP